MLSQPIRSVLADLATRFELAGVPYVLGGSAMLRLNGLEVTVGDLDIVVDGSSRHAIESMLGEFSEPPSREPWRSQWFLRSEWSVAGASVPVDIIGDMALMIDGEETGFPFDVERYADIGGASIPLAPLRQWYHLYRVHDPLKAILVAEQLSDEEILEGAAELGIGNTFSPTLIVRIGNESPPTEIEVDMSDAQSSIIEVASPTDQKFDEPGTEIIDLDLLNETLEYVRPALQADGGDLILLGTEGGKVSLQLVGACGGCPLSTMTLTSGIERILQDRVPGVTSVVSV